MRPKKLLAGTLAGVVLFQVSGCGTLLYPERSGQSAGRLDPTVVILDGLGLFFFLIPGIVAFALDFSNNTIYLPGGGGAGDAGDAGESARGYRKVVLDGPMDPASIEAFVRRELGVSDALARADLDVRAANAAETRAIRALALR